MEESVKDAWQISDWAGGTYPPHATVNPNIPRKRNEMLMDLNQECLALFENCIDKCGW